LGSSIHQPPAGINPINSPNFELYHPVSAFGPKAEPAAGNHSPRLGPAQKSHPWGCRLPFTILASLAEI
jgi:hypothetical protein